MYIWVVGGDGWFGSLCVHTVGTVPNGKRITDVQSRKNEQPTVSAVELVRNLVFVFGLLHFDTVGTVQNRKRMLCVSTSKSIEER